jgi:group I intron endonuclease
MKAQYGSKKKYHYLYKTTNLINGKFYYGMHSTDSLKDGYKGSGTLLKRSINKYGIENFKLEILEFFDTREALMEAEKKLITELQVVDSNCMNLKPGGSGGFLREVAIKGSANRSKKMLLDPDRRARWLEACRVGKAKAREEGRVTSY